MVESREVSDTADEPAASTSPPAASTSPPVATTPRPAEPMPSWRVAAVEVLLAVVLGAGLSYGFRELWSWEPYVAAIAAPVCLCLAVAAVGIVRMRRGYPMMPFGVLLVVLFVLTVLVTLPAAWVLAAAR